LVWSGSNLLLDTGVFDDDRYWVVEVHYAKAGPEDLLMTVEAQRGSGGRRAARAADRVVPQHVVDLGPEFARVRERRRAEADEFYAELTPAAASEDEARVMRQAFAGMLWSTQLYHYDVRRWLDGDPGQPAPPASRRAVRNARWASFSAFDIMSMPDKWEYPWFGAWDLAFHSDATGWMAGYAPAMGVIATVLRHARQRPADDLVQKFLEHFAAIRDAIEAQGLWDETDGLFHDQLAVADGRVVPVALERYHRFFGDDYTVEYPTGSGRTLPLDAIARDLWDRLIAIFLVDAEGRRPCFGWADRFQRDPRWKDNVAFFEYFHADNGAGLGASHQTGWTGLVADIIRRRHGGVTSLGDVLRAMRDGKDLR